MADEKGNNAFKFKMTEWRGYVIRALEGMDQDMGKLHVKIDNCACKDEFRKLEEVVRLMKEKQDNMFGRVAVIGGIVALIVTVIVSAVVLRFWG